MKILLGFLLLMTIISGCSSKGSNLKSPCVAIDSLDGTAGPCIKRRVNDHWLI